MRSNKIFQTKRETPRILTRHEPQKAPYSTYLIVCEGKTERLYFKGLRSHYRLNIANILFIEPKGSAPITLVDEAIKHVKSNPGIDHVYCVFDRDSHTTYHQAIDKINGQNSKKDPENNTIYEAITSTPCFEIWILLHFAYTTQQFQRTGTRTPADNLKSLIKKEYLPDYSETNENVFNLLIEKLPVALKNSKKLLQENERTQSNNPETKLHLLVELLMNLKR
ncbi:MAG TPA: RloB family protein [Gammaproteobacteria bacterium]|nr:RloB family protein [Gammaproteobacteria bacterium]